MENHNLWSINHSSESLNDEEIREVGNEYMQGMILYAVGFMEVFQLKWIKQLLE